MVEALYVIEFGDVAVAGRPNSGVIVLETNRIFGGDSGFYYLGEYTVKDGTVTARADIIRHQDGWTSAYGPYNGPFELKMSGRIVGRNIVGTMVHMSNQQRLRLVLRWKANLPG